MPSMRAGVALALSVLLLPASASAFCGFYVSGAEGSLYANATMVVLMREGTRTVLSMQNDYEGPPESFAMIVPVPAVLSASDVHTLPRAVFDRVDALSAPRLVEYWEEDPCAYERARRRASGSSGGSGARGADDLLAGALGVGELRVRVEAEFAVGEYDIVILGADEASALEEWLHAHHYRIPEGAAELLRPYVEEGMKFFVARVDVDRVRFEEGRAVLSPLRFHYESERFSLPVRLGLLSADGPQDLIVNILARHQRYEVANYENVLVPTNLDVDDAVRSSFGTFYATLFDALRERHPGAVVTEYAWGAGTCDPCPPEGSLEGSDLASLGADVMFEGGVVTGGGGAAPSVRVDVEAASGLPSEVVRRVARRHINELRYCYEQSIMQEGTGGALALGLALGLAQSGVVDTSAIEGEGPPGLLNCLQRAARRWTFPEPEGPGEVRLRVRFASEMSRATSVHHWVLTRLHYRYDRTSLGEDLVFRAADPVEGGRERFDESGAIERTATAAFLNNFQARFVIRHPFEGAIACASPLRGVWGGPPGGTEAHTTVATDVGAAARTGITLAAVVRSPVPELELGPPPALPAAPVATPAPAPAPAPPAPAAHGGRSTVGCGCAASSGSWSALGLAPLTLALVFIRRR
jgi:hypothetical protein